MFRDNYASGPFTRVEFFIEDGRIRIAVPRMHFLGVRGDQVYTLSNLSAGKRFL